MTHDPVPTEPTSEGAARGRLVPHSLYLKPETIKALRSAAAWETYQRGRRVTQDEVLSAALAAYGVSPPGAGGR